MADPKPITGEYDYRLVSPPTWNDISQVWEQFERFIRINTDGTISSYTVGYSFPDAAWPDGFLRPGLVSEDDYYNYYVEDQMGSL